MIRGNRYISLSLFIKVADWCWKTVQLSPRTVQLAEFHPCSVHRSGLFHAALVRLCCHRKKRVHKWQTTQSTLAQTGSFREPVALTDPKSCVCKTRKKTGCFLFGCYSNYWPTQRAFGESITWFQHSLYNETVSFLVLYYIDMKMIMTSSWN